VFGRGWSRRVSGVESAALALVSGEARQGKPPSSLDATTGKAVVPVEKGRAKAGVTATVATGVGIGWLFDRPAIWLVVLAAIAAVILIGFFVWRWRQRRAQEAVVTLPSTKGASHGLG
jgi:lysozyme family protein